MRDGVIDRQTVDGLTLLTLAGELDISVLVDLRRDLTRSANATRPDVAVDLRQVTFMDGSSLGPLLALCHEVREAGGCLRLIGAEKEPMRLIRICRLEGVFCVHDSLEGATATVCGRHQNKPVQ